MVLPALNRSFYPRPPSIPQAFNGLRQRHIQLAHIRRQQGHRERAAVTGSQNVTQHRFEIMDITVHMLAELRVLIIMKGNRARLSSVEQLDRAAGEDAPVALQIGGPA